MRRLDRQERGPRQNEDPMTKNARRKKSTRQRAASTGQTYTQASDSTHLAADDSDALDEGLTHFSKRLGRLLVPASDAGGDNPAATAWPEAAPAPEFSTASLNEVEMPRVTLGYEKLALSGDQVLRRALGDFHIDVQPHEGTISLRTGDESGNLLIILDRLDGSIRQTPGGADPLPGLEGASLDALASWLRDLDAAVDRLGDEAYAAVEGAVCVATGRAAPPAGRFGTHTIEVALSRFPLRRPSRPSHPVVDLARTGARTWRLAYGYEGKRVTLGDATFERDTTAARLVSWDMAFDGDAWGIHEAEAAEWIEVLNDEALLRAELLLTWWNSAAGTQLP